MPTVEQLEQQITQRMNQLASADPQCQRWMGQLDILRQMAEPDLKVHKEEGDD